MRPSQFYSVRDRARKGAQPPGWRQKQRAHVAVATPTVCPDGPLPTDRHTARKQSQATLTAHVKESPFPILLSCNLYAVGNLHAATATSISSRSAWTRPRPRRPRLKRHRTCAHPWALIRSQKSSPCSCSPVRNLDCIGYGRVVLFHGGSISCMTRHLFLTGVLVSAWSCDTNLNEHAPRLHISLLTTQISDNKTVEKVVIHGDDSDRYLSTSEGGVAHVLDLHLSSVDSWFKDSPYTWGAPQGTSSTMVLIRGRWKRYSVRTRTCTPPMVCSLMPADVANMPHTEVNFDDPTWLSAMAMCEDDDDPASRVHKTSMVS